MKKNSDKFLIYFISFIVLIVLVWFPINHVLLHFGIKELQTTDNWVYYKKTKTGLIGKMDDFIESNKVNLENRVTNYFPFYHSVNSAYYNLIINCNNLIYKGDFPIGLNSSNEYVFYNDINKVYYLRNNHSNIELSNRVEKQAKLFNELSEITNASLNIYIVPRLEQTSLIDDNLSSYTKQFKSLLDDDINVSELSVNSIDEYVNKFYATDHHWNMFGAYEGYKDIMNMLNKDSLDLNIKQVNNNPYYGSLAKSSLSTLTYDDVYDVEYNHNLNIFVNNSEAPLKYKPRNMNYSQKYEFFDQYIHYFDGQYGLVKYTNKDANKNGNLLIFSDSYAWQIDYLIASEYKNTYIINLRYDDYANGKINYKEFIEQNNIDDVLFLYEGSATIFDQYDYGFNSKIVR